MTASLNYRGLALADASEPGVAVEVEKNAMTKDRWTVQNVDDEVVHFLLSLDRTMHTFGREEIGKTVLYVLYFNGLEIGEWQIGPDTLRGYGVRWTERIATGESHLCQVFVALSKRIIERLEFRFGPWAEAWEHLQQEMSTPDEESAGKKRGPMDTKLDALLAGQTGIREGLSGLRQAVLARFDASEQTIIAAVIERLDQSQLVITQAVLQAVEAGHVPESELQETLTAVQYALSEIRRQGVSVSDSTLANEVECLSEVVDAPKLDIKHKLKIAVPIIPFILSYEGEVELKSGLNLEATWKRLVARVQDT